MAALGETGGGLLKAQVKQPPSPKSQQQQQQQQQQLLQQHQQQLQNLLQQHAAVTATLNGSSNLLNSPKSSRNGPFDFYSQHLSSESMSPGQTKASVVGSKPGRTKPGLLTSSSDHVNPTNGSNGFSVVKSEPTLASTTSSVLTSSSSTTTSKSVMSPSNRDDKKVNNNSVSYTPGGRLKFFKGSYLLENLS